MSDDTNLSITTPQKNSKHLKITIFTCSIATIALFAVIGLLIFQRIESSRINNVARVIDSGIQKTTIKKIGALTNTVTTSTVDNTGYFTIKEWGVRYKIPDSISVISYKVQLNKTCWNANGQFAAPCSQIILTGALKGEESKYNFSDITKCDLSYSLRSPIDISFNGSIGGAAQSIALIGPNKFFVTDANSFEINSETGKCQTESSYEYWSMQTVSTLLTRMLMSPEPVIPLDWEAHDEFKYGEGVPADDSTGTNESSNDGAGVAAPTESEINEWLGKQADINKTEGEASVIGDANLDGSVNSNDLDTIQKWIGYSTGTVDKFSFRNADVNADNSVNLLDGMVLMGYLKGLTPTLPVGLETYNPYGDLNFDGSLTEADSAIMAQMISSNTAEWGQWEAADLNLDGMVDSKDQDILSKYLTKVSGYENLPKTN